MTDNTARASIVAVMGATGAGKSSAINSALAADKGERRLIYDPGEDYGAHGNITDSCAEVARQVVAAGAGPFRVVFRPALDLARARSQFNWLCLVALTARNVLVVADELEDVTLPNWSPPGWSALVRKGRKYGVRIIGASQRPAGIEKRIWSMATLIQSGRLNDIEDARTVARVLMVDPLEVMGLPPLAWIRRSIYKPVIQRGRIEWRAGKPRDVLESEINIPAAGSA